MPQSKTQQLALAVNSLTEKNQHPAANTPVTKLEAHFLKYRKHVLGNLQYFNSPYGKMPLIYADWTASGRLYAKIEERMLRLAPFVGNTHTETSITGSAMTQAYQYALQKIKQHVNAAPTDVIISTGSGMTGVVNKLQRILGLKIHERFESKIQLNQNERPVIFVSHMEHHSNQTSWLETIGEVVVIQANDKGLVDTNYLKKVLQKYNDRKVKIAAVTSCSNVTGIITPYYEIAKIMHQHQGYCFVDFACAAPYIDINMHPEDEESCLDAIYFSPHKFLGGPGSSGILLFSSTLYNNRIPDCPGGGIVDWTNPWGQHKFVDDIETREDGGTPSFLQTLRVASCIQLKEQMDVKTMLAREKELLSIIWQAFDSIVNLHVLANEHRDRIGVVSFYIDDLHYNLAVRLLNDKFGIQVRGGCSCAGTYGHYLLQVSEEKSKSITDKINFGDLSVKPGWIRLSIHPTMATAEVEYIVQAIAQLAQDHKNWSKDYTYHSENNAFFFKHEHPFAKAEGALVEDWFNTPLV